MPNGGSFHIRAKNFTKSEYEAKPTLAAIDADYVLLEVADTGVGIPKEYVDRNFRPVLHNERSRLRIWVSHGLTV